MGMNYYEALYRANGAVVPGQHIGKLSAGEGGPTFLWAIPPAALEAVDAVVDEAGTVYTFPEFAAVLHTCATRDVQYVGVEFS